MHTKILNFFFVGPICPWTVQVIKNSYFISDKRHSFWV